MCMSEKVRLLKFICVIALALIIACLWRAIIPHTQQEEGIRAAQRLAVLTKLPSTDFTNVRCEIQLGMRNGPVFYTFEGGPHLLDSLQSSLNLT